MGRRLSCRLHRGRRGSNARMVLHLHAIAGLASQCGLQKCNSTDQVLDKDGNKMSKRKGNVVDPFWVPDHGADVVRWYMMENAIPAEILSLTCGIEETQRSFCTLQNTYSFFALYANIDDL